jgi:hypothetical protein
VTTESPRPHLLWGCTSPRPLLPSGRGSSTPRSTKCEEIVAVVVESGALKPHGCGGADQPVDDPPLPGGFHHRRGREAVSAGTQARSRFRRSSSSASTDASIHWASTAEAHAGWLLGGSLAPAASISMTDIPGRVHGRCARVGCCVCRGSRHAPREVSDASSDISSEGLRRGSDRRPGTSTAGAGPFLPL